MNRSVSSKGLAITLIVFLFGAFLVAANAVYAATNASSQLVRTKMSNETPGESLSGLILRYAEAMASEQLEEWARLDLGCVHRQHKTKSLPGTSPSQTEFQACWDATMTAHRTLVASETEPGIFGALGRGTGFGLIHASHQHADFWKDYPPALAVSPSVIREDPKAPIPLIRVEKVLESRSAGLVIEGIHEPVNVKKVSIDVSVTYPDPLSAPLALLPHEPWWASPVIRKYAPVRNLTARFEVVTGLKALGYSVDQAVVNDALPGAPIIAKPSEPGILPSSPQWWDRTQTQDLFEKEVEKARTTDSFQERVKKFQRLLLLDPKEPRANGLYGMDLYIAFLQEGLAKGKIKSKDKTISQKLGELYWNIQAQALRQEFTEVASGHSFAADVFYQAMPALKTALKDGKGRADMQRRLGALYRWNNDTASALTIHEQMLSNVPQDDQARRAQILSEIAWDRLQWLSWNRRYDHPWMTQTRKEAEQSLNLAKSPIDKLMAGEALVILDALAVPRDQSRLQKHVAVVRTYHDQLSGVAGMWDHLVGNDLVKSLVPEGLEVQLPAPMRSPEVMPLEVHSRIQDRNFFKTWNFDKDKVGELPTGFSMGSTQKIATEGWRIAMETKAPSAPHVVTQSSPCQEKDCFQVLLEDEDTHALPDIVVYIRELSTSGQGEAGIILAAKDTHNFYAVTLNPTDKQLSIYRVQNDKTTQLGKGSITLKKGPWHVLRVQMVNSAHVDHPLLELYVDGYETTVMAAEPVKGMGHIGLVTKGDMVAQFDRLGVIEMITSRPLSRPAAY